jgi:cysteinyl-tRNA synthetase
MAGALLGKTFDIHAGGIDLVFPHHENEIAQTCCAFGIDKMASIWMHNGFLQVEGQKMSKSLGNFVTINELLTTDKFGGRSWPGEVLRLAMLKTHYRQPIDWTVRALEEAERTLAKWHRRIADSGTPDPVVDPLFIEAFADDLDCAAAFQRVHSHANWGAFADPDAPQPEQTGAFGFGQGYSGFVPDEEILHRRAQLRFCLELLGLYAPHPELGEEAQRLITARLEARRNKQWAESDRIRDELAAMGIQLKDGKDADGNPVTTWEVKR